MAAIHFGQQTGELGFARVVALKRLHPQLATDKEFVTMFVDEARVSARIHHPNVVGVHDVVRDGEELVLVMDYVHGEPLSKLIRAAIDRGERVPPRIAAGIVAQALHGLHAAHEALGENGKSLQIVHRDVSPQNILVGADGVTRVVDFGVAKALGRAQHTAEGGMKGKVRYFAPEQLTNDVDRRTDVFAAGVVLWEALRGERLFSGDTQWEVVQSVISGEIPDPSEGDASIPADVAAVTLKALARERTERFPTAAAMAAALERTDVARTSEIADWVIALVGDELEARREEIASLDGLADAAPASIRAPIPRAEGAAATPAATQPSLLVQEGSDPDETDREEAPRARRAASGSRFPWVAVIGAVVGASGIAFGVGVGLRAGREPATPPTSVDTTRPVATETVSPSFTKVTDVPTPSPSSSVRVEPVPVASASAAPSPSASASSTGVPNNKTPSIGPTSKDSRIGASCDANNPCGPNGLCNAAGKCECVGDVCGGLCRDTFRDRNNCGGCGIVCTEGQYCRGACLECRRPIHDSCDGVCVEIVSDVANCGACGRRCDSSQFCRQGNCVPLPN